MVTSLDFGGVEKHMELIGACAARAAMSHRFCAIAGGGAAASALAEAGAAVDCLRVRPHIPSLAAAAGLYRLFRRVRPSVVHTHGAEANFHGLLAARLAGVPVRIGEEIGIPVHGARARAVFRQVYRAAHRVVAISDAVRRWLVENREVSERKACRLYNPVLLPAPRTLAPPPGTPLRIGFVGRLEPVKNPLALVQAVGLLRDGGLATELWLVGEGSERGRIEAHVRAHGLEGCVRLLGFQADPGAFLRQCDLYVQPSLSEGFGLALVEALGCGLPVLATRVGGAPEILVHGRTGWLLEGADAAGIARCLRPALALGRARLFEMGRDAERSIRGRFECDRYLQALEALYQDLLQGQAAR